MSNKTKTAIKRIFSLFLAICLVMTVLPPSADAAGTAELKRKLSNLEKQEETVKSKIASLNKEQASALSQKEYYDKQVAILAEEIAVYEDIIATYQEQIDEVDGEIRNLSDRIDAMETSIEVKKHQHDGLYKNFKTRIRVMYEEDIVSYAGIVFLADSIGDLLERLEAVMNILRADRSTMNKLETLSEEIAADEQKLTADRADLEKEVDELEALQNEQKESKKQLDVKMDSLEEKQQEANALYTAIKRSLDKNQDLLKEIEDAEKQLEKDIKEASESGGDKKPGTPSITAKGELAWPLPGNNKITCPYGYRTHPVTGKKNSFHTGIDIAAAGGTPIRSAAAGTVTKKCYNSAYGNMIVVNHGGGLSTMYCHMRSAALYSVGDKVSKGTILGYVGTTGLSTGNHLHLSVLENGDYVNPMKYFKKG